MKVDPRAAALSSTKAAPSRLCRFRLTALLALLLVFGGGACHGQSGEKVLVDKVYDGDTVRLRDGRTVRLFGLDAPEMGYDGRLHQVGAQEASRKLTEMVRGVELTLVPAPGVGTSHGRIVAVLGLPDGRLVNEELIAAGLAFYYPHPNQGSADSPWLHERLLQAQREAMLQGRGVWPHLAKLPHLDRPMRGNARSLRFFSLDCEGVDKISRGNRVMFSSAQEAFAAGYAPARHCGLWPEVKT
jgi:micrococcal nuclease